MANYVGMPNYVDTLKEIRRVSERALAERESIHCAGVENAVHGGSSHALGCGHAAVDGFMTSNMRHLFNLACSTLKVCGELYWSKFTKPDAIAETVRAEVEELLGCAVTWVCVGDSGETDIGYELISEKGNFCFAVRLEGSMWRVYGLKCGQPLKNVGELIKEVI